MHIHFTDSTYNGTRWTSLMSKNIIITGWPSTKDEVIDGVIMKGRYIIIPVELEQWVLDQLHLNHMVIEKTKLLMCTLVYWVKIETDKHIKGCNTWLEFQQIQPKEKTIHHDIPLRPWKVLGADIFHINNENYLCVIDYHSKFPVIKRMEGLSTESLITTTKVIFAEYSIPHKLMSDAGNNFVSEKFRTFCSRVNINQTVSLAYHHRNNGQVKASMKFIKCTIKNAQPLLVIFTWQYCKSILHHWGKVYLVCQHCCLIIWYTV